MITTFQLRAGATPAQAVSLVVQINEHTATEMMAYVQQVLTAQSVYPEITALLIHNTAEVLFLSQSIDEAYKTITEVPHLPYLQDLNTRLIASSSGVHWEAFNEQLLIRTAILPFNVIKYLAAGAHFGDQSLQQIISTVGKIFPVKSRRLFANH